MSGNNFKPQLNAGIDRERAKASFAFHRRVEIANLLLPADADIIHDCLAQHTPWGFAYWDKQEIRLLSRQDTETMTRARAERIARDIQDQAQEGQFSFAFHCLPLGNSKPEGHDVTQTLNAVADFLNAPDMLTLVREVAAMPELAVADAQATLMGQNHFLGVMPVRADVPRRIAFSLNFTRNWCADWGGYLQFYSADGDISHGIMPAFNSLTLFEVPQSYGISTVPAHAPLGRLAITGYFRTADSHSLIQ